MRMAMNRPTNTIAAPTTRGNGYPQHVVAAGMLVERGEKVLLVRTPRRGWEFPGGQIEEGESVVDGVLREVSEEAGVVAAAGRLAGVYSNLSSSRVIFDFVGTWVAGVARADDETIDVAWVLKEQARQMIEHPGYRERLRQLLAFDGRVLFESYTTDPFTVRERHYL